MTDQTGDEDDIMIRAEGVTRAFGKNRVLKGVDLAIRRGESRVVIGGSGSGKSVLIKCLIGLIPADGGRIVIDGIPLSHATRSEVMRQVGMLFQGGALFDSLPVWENVAFRLLRGEDERVDRARARAIAIEKLARVGLGPETADLYPAELSGGMQKRVGLARAIAHAPSIIFFDEPTTGLDPIMAGVINRLIRSIVSETGATAVTITHDMVSVRTIADRVSMLHEGVIRWTGPVERLDDPGDPYVAQFVRGAPDGPIRVEGAA